MRLKEYLITEARKNPDLNPKLRTMQELKALLRKHPDGFVSFTHLPKFGMNPSSEYNTPIGLYAYKLSDVVEFLTSMEHISKTFAANFRYIQVFTVDPSAYVWELDDKTINKEVQEKIITSQKNLGYKTAGFTRAVTDKKLWYAIYKFIDPDFKTEDEDESDNTKGVQARKLLRQAGIDGVIDSGYGIIHPNEPDQAVFFNIKQLHRVAMLTNNLYNDIKTDRIDRMLSNPSITGYAQLHNVYTELYQPAPIPRKKQLLPILQQAALKLVQTIKVPNISTAKLLLEILPPNPPYTGPVWKAVEPILIQYIHSYYLIMYAMDNKQRLPLRLERIAHDELAGGGYWRDYIKTFPHPE